jgi:hypothetical protein
MVLEQEIPRFASWIGLAVLRYLAAAGVAALLSRSVRIAFTLICSTLREP